MLIFAAILFAVTNPMTPYMSLDEQKKTGVEHLSRGEQAALAEWLSSRSDHDAKKELTLSLNIRSGEILQLSNGTLWQVAPKDVPTASAWLTPVKIEFKESSNVNYPTILINSETHQQVMTHPLHQLQKHPS